MTEFKRTAAAVDKMEQLLPTLVSCDSAPDRKAALDQYTALRDEWLPVMTKIKGRADEKDPDKQVYGEAMVEKVKALWARFEAVRQSADSTAESVLQQYAPHAEAEREAEAETERQQAAELARLKRLAEEEEERAQAAAAERRRREEEAEAERKRRYAEQVRLAVEHKARLEQEREEDERERGRLEMYLNSTPSRELLRRGLLELQQHCMALAEPDAGRRPVGLPPGRVPWGLRVLEDTLRALAGFMRNLVGHPDSQALKHVRCANENFVKDIGSRGSGALTVLYSVGYRPAGYGENKFLVLEEIDCERRYAEWEQWWEEVKWTRDMLADLCEKLRIHRRSARPDQHFDMAPLIPEPATACTFSSLAEVPVCMADVSSRYYS